VVPQRVVDELGDRVPDLGIAAGCGAGKVDVDALGSADRVAMGVEASDSEVPVVEVHPHHRPARPNLAVRCFGADVDGLRCEGP